MSQEKKPTLFKWVQKTFNLQIPLIFEAKTLDNYFIRKLGVASKSKLIELLEQVNGFSGFFDPEKLKIVYGKEITGQITPKMIGESINRYKKDQAPDWVVLDEQGYLQFNPEFSRYWVFRNIQPKPAMKNSVLIEKSRVFSF